MRELARSARDVLAQERNGELEAAPRPRDVRLRPRELVLELERRDGAVALGVVAARLADDQVPDRQPCR